MTNLISKAEFIKEYKDLKAYKERKGNSLLSIPTAYDFQQYEILCQKIDILAGLESVDEDRFSKAIEFTADYLAEKYCECEYEGSRQTATRESIILLTGQTPLKYLLSKNK